MGWLEIIGAVALILAVGLIVGLAAGIITAEDIYNFSKTIVENLTKLSPEMEINDFNGIMTFILIYCIFIALLFFAVKHEKLVTFISLALSSLILWKVKIFGIPAAIFGILGLIIWIKGNIS
ncbi:MAG: hypothetical protein QXD79_08225 [Candidatus Methanomethylicia archaeon]